MKTVTARSPRLAALGAQARWSRSSRRSPMSITWCGLTRRWRSAIWETNARSNLYSRCSITTQATASEWRWSSPLARFVIGARSGRWKIYSRPKRAKTSNNRSNNLSNCCAQLRLIGNKDHRDRLHLPLIRCFNHIPATEQVVDGAQANLFHLGDLRTHFLAIIDWKLAHHRIDSARLFEDGLLDLFQAVVAVLGL